LFFAVIAVPQVVLAQEPFTGLDNGPINTGGVVIAQQVGDIIFTPDSISLGPGDVSPPFGTMTRAFTTEYQDFGVVFGTIPAGDVPTAIFSDPPDAWGGVNTGGVVDLLTPIVGAIVLPGTTTIATTSFLRVEGGYADVGNLLLEVFDSNGNLLGSTTNDDGTGTYGRTLMILSIPGISYFRISTPAEDAFGVNEIQLNTPTAISASTPTVGGLILGPNTLEIISPWVTLFMLMVSIVAGVVLISRSKTHTPKF
jgi:hypothetical protein